MSIFSYSVKKGMIENWDSNTELQQHVTARLRLCLQKPVPCDRQWGLRGIVLHYRQWSLNITSTNNAVLFGCYNRLDFDLVEMCSFVDQSLGQPCFFIIPSKRTENLKVQAIKCIWKKSILRMFFSRQKSLEITRAGNIFNPSSWKI